MGDKRYFKKNCKRTVKKGSGSSGAHSYDSDIDLNSFSDSAQAKNSDKKSKSKASLKSKILRSVLTVFLVFVITGCIVAGAFMIYAFGFVDATMDEDLNDLALNFTTTIYVDDGSGNFVEYQRLHGEYNRIWVSDKDGNIPDNLKNAFIAIEDKTFRTHKGVNWKRTFSAFANLFFHFYSSNQGGSTITQQLVKNLTGDNSSSPARKIREILRAKNLEDNFSKDVILECYVNTVSMAGGMYGVEVASNYYFNKSTKDLTLNECAALAAIVKAPEQYRPDREPEANANRRKTVLYEMYDQGFITKEEYDAAVNEELVVVANKENLNETTINSYFVDALIDEVTADIAEAYGYDDKHASTNFYNGGYKIYATLNPTVQNSMEKVFTDTKYAYKGADGQLLQGAMTVMDYEGHIVGMVGGIGEKTANRGLNRAVDSPRQPGSTMKPISAYATAIENDLITYSTLVNDTEKYYKEWKPNNWYNHYKGNITVEYALEISCNTIPVFLVEKLTPQYCYDFLTQKLGIKNLNSNDIDYSPLGMGGTNVGITTLEEAAAYAVFGNGGIYYEPTTYYKVTDHHGEVILESTPESTVAISEDTATVMNHLLQNVVYGSEGTGAGAGSKVSPFKMYAKTGTSNDDMNCWFTGGTPYYIASTWCGYDQLQRVKQSTVAKTMWGEVMSQVHKGLENKSFVDSQYVTSKKYCTSSGMLATASCPQTDTGWYKQSNVPSMCTKHPNAADTTQTPQTE